MKIEIDAKTWKYYESVLYGSDKSRQRLSNIMYKNTAGLIYLMQRPKYPSNKIIQRDLDPSSLERLVMLIDNLSTPHIAIS